MDGPHLSTPGTFRRHPGGQSAVMGIDDQAHSSSHEPAVGDVVTVEILRELLGTEIADARLVLEAGKVDIASDAGGLVLISHSELLDRVGADPDMTELAEQAELLNTEVRLLGA
ncbi:hypothetical protein ACWDYH_18030 [Nocardia goodfellowii]